MLCQRCLAAWLGPDGRCPGCDNNPWRTAVPGPPQGYGAPYGHGYPAFAPPRVPPPVRLPGALSTALYILLGLCVIAELLGLIANSLEFSLYGRLKEDMDSVSGSEADAIDAFYVLTMMGRVPVTAITGIVFLIWFHRVRTNAETLGPAWPQRHSRGWAIGAWFVPLVNLWLPKRIADDIWNASDPAARPGDPRTGAGRVSTAGPVLCWWLAWAGGNVVSALGRAMEIGTEAHDFAGMQAMFGMEATSSALTAAAGVLAILVVRRITAMQGVRHAMASGGGGLGQPLSPPPAHPPDWGGHPH